MTRNTRSKTVLTASVIVLLVIAMVWAYGEIAYPKSNPPQKHTGDILTPQADGVLRRACFDCHSNETYHPWYAYLPGVNILVGNDVREGRRELNYSLWNQMTPQQRRKKLAETIEQMREGEMPLWQYTLMHPSARLTQADITTVSDAAKQRYNLTERDFTEGGERGEWGERGEEGEHGEGGEGYGGYDRD